MVTFIDLDKADDPLLKPHVSSLGYVWFDPDGTWHAFRPGTGFRMTSDGSIRDLEPGLWVSNLGYERAQVVAKAASHVILRSDEWLKMVSAQILGALGVEGVDGRKSGQVMSIIADRVYRLSQNVIRLRNPDPKSVSAVVKRIERAPSLATGLQNIHHEEMARTRPSEKRTLDVLEMTYQHGMYCFGRKKPADGHVNLSFHFPRLSYALEICAAQVPDRAVWQIGSRDEGTTSRDFLSEIEALNRPAIYRATHAHGPGMGEHVEAFVDSSRKSGSYRSLFLAEEIRHLMRCVDVTIESVVAGGGWRDSGTGGVLQLLVQACGGMEVATRSWSAALLAENILASTFRRVQSDKGGRLVESVWLAARDRARMLPVISDFYDIGATLVSAQLGNIVIQCPQDPEMLMLVLDTAWRKGLVLPASEAAMMSRFGVTPPNCRSSFGGLEADYILAAIAQGGRSRALLTLDTVLDVEPPQRAGKLRQLLS